MKKCLVSLQIVCFSFLLPCFALFCCVFFVSRVFHLLFGLFLDCFWCAGKQGVRIISEATADIQKSTPPGYVCAHVFREKVATLMAKLSIEENTRVDAYGRATRSDRDTRAQLHLLCKEAEDACSALARQPTAARALAIFLQLRATLHTVCHKLTSSMTSCSVNAAASAAYECASQHMSAAQSYHVSEVGDPHLPALTSLGAASAAESTLPSAFSHTSSASAALQHQMSESVAQDL
jgi:hypothetical protein